MFSRSLCFQGHSGMWRAFSIVMCPMFLRVTLTYTDFPLWLDAGWHGLTLSAYNSFVSSVVLGLSFLSLTQDGSDTGCPLEGGGWALVGGPQGGWAHSMFSTATTRSQSMFGHFAFYSRLRPNSNNTEWNTILNMLPVDVVRVLLLSDNPVDE